VTERGARSFEATSGTWAATPRRPAPESLAKVDLAAFLGEAIGASRVPVWEPHKHGAADPFSAARALGRLVIPDLSDGQEAEAGPAGASTRGPKR
jgi:hypothetical protein